VKLGRWCLIMVAGWLWCVAHASAQAPIPVAERITSQFGRTTRVSLFSNRVAVVTIRSDTEDYVRRATLTNEEYMVYLQALNQYSAEIGNEPVSSDIESRDSSATLTLHVGPDAPVSFEYSPVASMNLAAGKIVSIMDDIQLRVLSSRPGEDALRRWRPTIGDRVTLRHGGTAHVTSVGDDGTIVLHQEETGLLTTVAPDNRSEIILEVLESTP
jgi:hypothetical protein